MRNLAVFRHVKRVVNELNRRSYQNSKKGLENRRMGKHTYRGFDFIKYLFQFMRLTAKSNGKDV